MRKILNFFEREYAFSFVIFLFIALSIFYPTEIIHYPEFVDWQTIFALMGLLIITTALKQSGYFQLLSYRILKTVHSVRKLAALMILLSAFLSTFLTNDITLFIVVPVTLGMQDYLKNNLTKLIIFEAIAVNAGSSLTPIGNPQNLYLWHKWGINFLQFVIKMSPLTLLLISMALLFSVIFIKGELEYSTRCENYIDQDLFILSLIFLFSYIISLELHLETTLLSAIIVVYLLMYREVLSQVDWVLIFLFIFVFIDFHILSTIPFISQYAQKFPISSNNGVFIFSAIVSQFISNVPASVFISKFSHNWLAIAYGVNVGGSGFVTGSLANLIALRMAKNRSIWLNFHVYSLPYFFITLSIVYLAIM